MARFFTLSPDQCSLKKQVSAYSKATPEQKRAAQQAAVDAYGSLTPEQKAQAASAAMSGASSAMSGAGSVAANTDLFGGSARSIRGTTAIPYCCHHHPLLPPPRSRLLLLPLLPPLDFAALSDLHDHTTPSEDARAQVPHQRIRSERAKRACSIEVGNECQRR